MPDDKLWPPDRCADLYRQCDVPDCLRNSWFVTPGSADDASSFCALHAPPGYTLRTTAQPVSDADEFTSEMVDCIARHFYPDASTPKACLRALRAAGFLAAQPPALKVPSDDELRQFECDWLRSPHYFSGRDCAGMRWIITEIQKRGYIAAPTPECREISVADMVDLGNVYADAPGTIADGLRAVLSEAARRLLLPGAAELKELREEVTRLREQYKSELMVNADLTTELHAQIDAAEARAEKAEAEVARLKAEVERLQPVVNRLDDRVEELLMEKAELKAERRDSWCGSAMQIERRKELLEIVGMVAPEYDDSVQAGVGTCADIVAYAKRLQTAIDAVLSSAEKGGV